MSSLSLSSSAISTSFNPRDQLQHLWQRGCDFLGSRYAIMGGAMTWVSNHSLVAAISNAGGFGVLACGSMTPDLLSQEIEKTLALTDQPFGVNLILMHPLLSELMAVCGQYPQVKHVVLAGGIPKRDHIQTLKDMDKKILAFVPALAIGKLLVKMGVDALVIEGSEAGGHIGPVSTSVLVQEILPAITEVPIFVAGGIGRGEAVINYLQLGAAGCQLGTRFVCAHESPAHAKFKAAFVRANARDAVASVQLDPRFPVIPVRALNNNGCREFMDFQRKTITQFESGEVSLEEGQLAIEKYWAGALRRAVIDGDIDNGSLMAGQSVGLINKEQSTVEIIEELIAQAESYLATYDCNKKLA